MDPVLGAEGLVSILAKDSSGGVVGINLDFPNVIFLECPFVIFLENLDSIRRLMAAELL